MNALSGKLTAILSADVVGYNLRMARRKLYPIPVEGIIDHPDFIAMPAAAAGILFRLILHFWQTECRPLPESDLEKRYLARSHPPTWRRWSPVVLGVFEAIRPELEAYFRLRESRGTTLRFAGQRGGEISAAKLRRKTILASVSDEPARHDGSFRTTSQRARVWLDRPRPEQTDRPQRRRFSDFGGRSVPSTDAG